jgi:hypothetical protein
MNNVFMIYSCYAELNVKFWFCKISHLNPNTQEHEKVKNSVFDCHGGFARLHCL